MSTSSPRPTREPQTVSATSADGVSARLTLPGGYRPAPELERDGVLLAGEWATWPGPGERPGITTLRILEPAPARASIEQLCLEMLARESAAGRFVVDVDRFIPSAPREADSGASAGAGEEAEDAEEESERAGESEDAEEESERAGESEDAEEESARAGESEDAEEESARAGESEDRGEDPDGDPLTRRIVSLDLDEGLPIQHAHFLTFRAGRPVVLSASVDITKWDLGLRILSFEALTLEIEAAGPVRPACGAPAGRPELVSAGDGVMAESFGDLAARQPFHSPFPSVDPADVARLRGTTGWRPAHGPGLVAAGLVNRWGRLTDRGSAARGLLRRKGARIGAEVAVPGIDGERLFDARIDREYAVVVAEDPLGDNAIERTVDVIGREEMPLILARWIGLAPGWPVPLSAKVDTGPWSARMADPDAPVPPDASAALADFWRQPWRLAEVTTRGLAFGNAYMHWIVTPERGACTVRFSEDGVTLVRQRSVEAFRMLAMMCDVIPRDRVPARAA